jgi:hypothetical protein
MWNFLYRLLNTLILHSVYSKKKSGYSINILNVQLIGEFHLNVLNQLPPSSSLQTYSCLGLWKTL